MKSHPAGWLFFIPHFLPVLPIDKAKGAGNNRPQFPFPAKGYAMPFPVRSLTAPLLSILLLVGCGKETPGPVANSGHVPLVVKLGHAAPLTGPQAHLGKDNENGVVLAVEDVNASNIQIGGRPLKLELMSEDDQADPRQGTLVASKFVDAKVTAVIGHMNSGTTIPASKTYNDAGLPQISPSATNPMYTHQGFKNAFRLMANDEQQGRALGEFAAKTLKAKTVAVFDDKTAYGEGVAREFAKSALANGIQVVAEEHTDDKAMDFSAILTKAKSKKPDVIFFGGMDPQAAPMAVQLKRLGIAATLLLADGGCTPGFISAAGNASEGQYCSLPGVPLAQMPGGAKFDQHYKARFNNAEIQLYAPNAYDSVMVLVEAIKRAQSIEPAKIIGELHKTNYSGVTAHVQFDENGDIKDGAISFYKVQGGKLVFQQTLGGPAK
ncbi:Amino acid/amide ABC transporter substrate-binding protein (HAAT family) [Georgfuchsia toluolica]|uniref:Amino acid/amide ABC transporter substrate-binding protein (HAAT family) n=2 Tax=Georgfuchsia toluolica TaxID=424218 RepID=A0A916N9K1_9PROT|nr:Amino acid/amide ABC transporter substrate-binding protein (HAAT family) [Georgfuchsia toluolica]